jgi:tRNA dimethylallyltransferase
MSEKTRHPILIVAGPTASGKSALALELAAEFGGTIVNADSMQVYRDLPIVTAQPDAAARRAAPHRLYGEIDAAVNFSAGAWRARAAAEIAAVREEGRAPILVGGTGLYLRALLDGLAPTPPVPDEVRRAARALHAELGAEAFHQALAGLDPEAAARLNPSDRQRALRAYEVAKATGRSLGQWQREQSRDPEFSATAIVLLPSREPLYAACDARFLRMIEHGAVDEVRALLARTPDPALPAMKALGAAEIGAWLGGVASRAETIAAAQQATRNYAKRQYTWCKHQLPERPGLRKQVLLEQFSERLLPEIFAFIRQFLLTPES